MQSIPVASEGVEIDSQSPWRDRGAIERGRERDPPAQIGKGARKGWARWVGTPNLAYLGELRSRWKQEEGADLEDDEGDGDECVGGGVKARWRWRITSALMPISSWSSALRVALLLFLVVAIVSAFFTLPVEKTLKDFLIWINTNLGHWGPVVLAVAYIPLTILAVPASILTLGGGYLFGLPIGFVADSIGATIGAVAAFLLGRTIGRPYVLARLKDYPKFQAVAIAVESSGFKIILLLRLVPLLPFNMMNYLLSVTPVSLGQYTLASWLGMMPITFALVYVGTTLKDLSDVTHGWSEISTGRLVFLASSIVVSGILMVCVAKVAKNALEKALAENSNIASLNSSQLPSTSDLSLDLHQPLVIRVDPSSEDGHEK